MSEGPYSHLAETLIGSEIVKLGGIIKEKIRQGDKIYNYTIGDFDSSLFPIPEVLQQEIIKAFREGYTTYPLAEGELDLRIAVASFLKNQLSLEYTPEEILISNGGRPLIYSIFRSLVDTHDKVIYPVPSWNNNHYTHFTQGQHIQVEASPENNFMPTAQQLAPHIKGARLLALCSPLNPTGTVFTKNELEAICDLVIAENQSREPHQKKLFVLFDQIYWTLTLGETVHYNPVSLRPAMKAYTVFVDGISKAFAATGVRVGWSMGPQGLISKMKAINSHVGSWAPMAEQKGTARFLSDQTSVTNFLNNIKKEISFRLENLYNGFLQLREEGFHVNAIAPQAAIYLTVQFDLVGKRTQQGEVLNLQEDVTKYILDNAKLAIVPFGYFGAKKESNWYRISVGCCKKEEIPEMFQTLRTALQQLA